ncbi:MAG TPA: hypothetical protein VF189_03960, partial [Patescibacteria group bacterium]
MLDRETVAYIKASKQRGISDEIIRTELKKKDLSEKEITHALHLADSLLKENRPSHSESKDTSSHSSKQKSSRSEESTGWSWGAFILGPLFLLAIKKYYYLFLYLAYFIPFINFLAVFGIPIFLGIKGRELAYDSSMFETQHQASGFMSAVDHAGKIMFVVYLVG